MTLIGAVSRAELERCFERRWQAELLTRAGGGAVAAAAAHAAARDRSNTAPSTPATPPLAALHQRPVLVAPSAQPMAAVAVEGAARWPEPGGGGYRAPPLRQLAAVGRSGGPAPPVAAQTTFSGAQPFAVVEVGGPQPFAALPTASAAPFALPALPPPAIELSAWRPPGSVAITASEVARSASPSSGRSAGGGGGDHGGLWGGGDAASERVDDWQRLVTPPPSAPGAGGRRGSAMAPSQRFAPRSLLRRGATWLRSIVVRGPGAVLAHDFEPAWLDARIVWVGLPEGGGGGGDAATASPSTPLGISGGPRPAPPPALPDPPPQPVRLDPAPFQVAAATPLPKVHYLLCVCLFAELFVTRDGRLAGVIIKDDLGDGRRVSRERLLLAAGGGGGGGRGDNDRGGGGQRGPRAQLISIDSRRSGRLTALQLARYSVAPGPCRAAALPTRTQTTGSAQTHRDG